MRAISLPPLENYAAQSTASDWTDLRGSGHGGRVWLNFFNESQRGSYKWGSDQHIVQVNRTEALDAAKKAIRDGKVILPRRVPLLETFAEHLASDAKKLVEDPETGAKTYRYIRTGTNHYSLAFTYDWIASEDERGPEVHWGFLLNDDDNSIRPIMWHVRQALGCDAAEWPSRWWDRKF